MSNKIETTKLVKEIKGVRQSLERAEAFLRETDSEEAYRRTVMLQNYIYLLEDKLNALAS